jgi:HK97 family phage portal protein
MALLDFFRRRRPDLTTKAVYDDSKFVQSSISILDNAAGRGKMPPFSMQRSVLSFESWVYAAAMLNAQAASSVPLRLYVRTDAQGPQKFWRTRKVSRARKAYLLGDSERKPSPSVMKSAATAGDFEEVVDAHPILELLRKANQYEDGFSQSVMRMLYMELCGNAYLHVVMDKALGVPSEIYTVPAQNVTILPGKTELVEAYLYGVNRNEMQRFELDEIIHFKRPNPRNLYYGLGKVEAAYGAIQQSQAAHIQDLSFLENMSRPDYAAIVKGGASEASMRRFEESMRSLHQGTRKSGRMVTISGDIQLMPLNFPSKDLTGRDDIVEEISACFGVPVSMLKANDPNLASAQAGYSMWRETTIAPICRMDEETLNSRLLPMFGIHEDAYLAYDNPVPENRVADSAERSVAVAGGWRTPNEARLEEGYEALETPHADMLHVNGLPLGGVAPVSPFGAPAPMPSYAAPAPAPVDEPAQLPPTAEVEQPAAKALSDVDTTPTDEMATLALRGLKYREEFGRGGTAVGVARARDIGNMVSLSPDTVGRMNSFFARHHVDLDAVGARSGDEGYPSAGAIAWMLWGGDPNNPEGAGAAWAARKAEELASASDVKSKAVDCVGDKISTLIGEGYAQDQAVAIAISMCGGKSFDDALIEYESARQEKMASARVKIAAMEAKAWDAVQQQPKIDALQAELDAMKDRTQSLDEIVTMLTEALGDEA